MMMPVFSWFELGDSPFVCTEEIEQIVILQYNLDGGKSKTRPG